LSKLNFPFRKKKNLIFENYFTSRTIHSSANDLMTNSLDRTRHPLINNINTDRIILLSKSTEHSPRHHHSSLTPTNAEQSKRKI
jgi:hypothetical protein